MGSHAEHGAAGTRAQRSSRRAFVRALAAVLASAAGARTASAENTTPSGSQFTDQGQLMLAVAGAIELTMHGVQIVWRPPSLFPADAPIACYVGLGGDTAYPDRRVIWLNPDHPELVSPRRSHLTDEVPLMTELLVASVDMPAGDAPPLGLDKVSGTARREAAFALATRVAVVAKYSPYEQVDDAEFASRRFAFAVLRQMTPGIGGVAQLVVAAAKMPADEPLACYAGRDIDPNVPAGWGVIDSVGGNVRASADGFEAWVRAFTLATADAQPPDSAVKRAYDEARRRDDAAGGHDANRRSFAAPYVKQVSALFGR